MATIGSHAPPIPVERQPKTPEEVSRRPSFLPKPQPTLHLLFEDDPPGLMIPGFSPSLPTTPSNPSQFVPVTDSQRTGATPSTPARAGRKQETANLSQAKNFAYPTVSVARSQTAPTYGGDSQFDARHSVASTPDVSLSPLEVAPQDSGDPLPNAINVSSASSTALSIVPLRSLVSSSFETSISPLHKFHSYLDRNVDIPPTPSSISLDDVVDVLPGPTADLEGPIPAEMNLAPLLFRAPSKLLAPISLPDASPGTTYQPSFDELLAASFREAHSHSSSDLEPLSPPLKPFARPRSGSVPTNPLHPGATPKRTVSPASRFSRQRGGSYSHLVSTQSQWPSSIPDGLELKSVLKTPEYEEGHDLLPPSPSASKSKIKKLSAPSATSKPSSTPVRMLRTPSPVPQPRSDTQDVYHLIVSPIPLVRLEPSPSTGSLSSAFRSATVFSQSYSSHFITVSSHLTTPPQSGIGALEILPFDVLIGDEGATLDACAQLVGDLACVLGYIEISLEKWLDGISLVE